MTRNDLFDRGEFVEVENQSHLDELLALLRQNPWVRTVQLISTVRVDDEGKQRGYDAHVVFQADLLNSQPVELLLDSVVTTRVDGAGEAHAKNASGSIDDVGVKLNLTGASFVASKLTYRKLPGGRAPGDPSGGIVH